MKDPDDHQARPMRDRKSLVRSTRVRPMQVGDIPRVKQIADGLPQAPHWPVGAYEAALSPNSEPRRVALVAEGLDSAAQESDPPTARAVVGFVVASLVAGEAELESIAVAAEAQHRGSGGMLLGHLVAALKELKVARINLEVRASNHPALGLYAQHGFGQTGRRVGYYADPVEDAVLMELGLN
jgi:ribosomal-protein-alanine N-acetyltransferase